MIRSQQWERFAEPKQDNSYNMPSIHQTAWGCVMGNGDEAWCIIDDLNLKMMMMITFGRFGSQTLKFLILMDRMQPPMPPTSPPNTRSKTNITMSHIWSNVKNIRRCYFLLIWIQVNLYEHIKCRWHHVNNM